MIAYRLPTLGLATTALTVCLSGTLGCQSGSSPSAEHISYGATDGSPSPSAKPEKTAAEQCVRSGDLPVPPRKIIDRRPDLSDLRDVQTRASVLVAARGVHIREPPRSPLPRFLLECPATTSRSSRRGVPVPARAARAPNRRSARGSRRVQPRRRLMLCDTGVPVVAAPAFCRSQPSSSARHTFLYSC
jgi:hypothetical protein